MAERLHVTWIEGLAVVLLDWLYPVVVDTNDCWVFHVSIRHGILIAREWLTGPLAALHTDASGCVSL